MSSQNQNIDLNPQFIKAIDLMELGDKNIFITGKAGTGKSTLLNHFRQNTKKKVAVLAPTGSAAVNIKGQTIHSFFSFKPSITLESIKIKSTNKNNKKNIYKALDIIIIDEISMVRADLLDCIDKFLRLNGKKIEQPFGGVQIVFIGDLYQLPPVVSSHEKEIFKSYYSTPYFFSARCFEQLEMEFIELDKIYRQSDQYFINLLNAIRNNSITDIDIAKINARYNKDFEPEADDFYIYLTTTNANAELINIKRLDQINNKQYIFEGEVEGEFGKEQLPTPTTLKLKIGSQIMMLNNDSNGRWINGTIGVIVGIDINEEPAEINILLETGTKVNITPHNWELYNFYLDGAELQSKIVGTYKQYPLMLAWAITIHKSQGKTFEKAILDIGNGTFAHGQMYVALSRCTSLEGLVLKKEIAKRHIIMDYNVVRFVTQYQYNKAAALCSVEERIEIIKSAINNKSTLNIIYLKANDEKSFRQIQPINVGEMQYLGRNYLGLEAFCLTKQSARVFRVDRILEIN